MAQQDVTVAQTDLKLWFTFVYGDWSHHIIQESLSAEVVVYLENEGLPQSKVNYQGVALVPVWLDVTNYSKNSNKEVISVFHAADMFIYLTEP